MKLDFRPFDLLPRHPWAIANVKPGAGVEQVVLARISVNNIDGLGEAPTSARYSETLDSIQDFLRGVDPAKLSIEDIPGSLRYLEQLAPGNFSAKCAINTALVDAAAQTAGKAIYDWLGLGFSEGKHVTSFSIGIDSPEMIRRKTFEAEAFPILKLKVGSPNDRQNLAALREAAPNKTVRVDANEAWTTKEDALRNLEWLAKDPHIEFVEQPMPAQTPAAEMAWLKSRSPLPLFADESYHHASDVALCAECFHGVNVKLMKAGGISPAFDALSAARNAGLKTMIGCMIETSVLISAAAHLAELADYLDIDGNLLASNDPYTGVTAEKGVVSFARAPKPLGLRVAVKGNNPFI